MFSYTIHPIAIKLWEVVEDTPTKNCMKKNWKINWKNRKFVYYKIEPPFFYVRIYLEKYRTEFSTICINGLAVSRKKFLCVIRLKNN